LKGETKNIILRLAHDKQIECPAGTLIKDLIEQIGTTKNPEEIIAAKVNGTLVDLSYPLFDDATVDPVYRDSPEGKEVFRHSTSHIMAQAVKDLFPKTKIAIGPAIEDGFYYDFDRDKPFSPQDLEKIEQRMKEIIQQDLPFQRLEVSKEQAQKIFQEKEEDYKLELLEEIEEDRVSLYQQGNFIDLCRGPHVLSSKKIGPFKLLHTAGAYWRGNEKNKMLQRIYGTAFPTPKALEEYLNRLEEARKRDHRVLGRQLDLFSIQEDIGPGLIHWHPKGAIIRLTIEDFWRKEHLKRGYQLVYTPHIASQKIYQISGHLETYQENMYSPMDIDGIPYWVKPMNCPGHIKIYQTKLRSYRELPIRYAELGTVYRYERSGVLHGMLRVRGFTQDDSHIFCPPEKLASEIMGVLDLVDFMMNIFGFEYHAYLATRPDKSIGTEEAWTKATQALRDALHQKGIEYKIDQGGGVFYGPKIDIKLLDALGRAWQGPTIQVDFNLPERFDITYIGADGNRHKVVMIHRTVLGSLERFIGGLIEHYAGAFPLWIAPVQVIVITITEKHIEYGDRVVQELINNDIRAEADFRNEMVGYKIREAQLAKIPYMAVVGDREKEQGTVSLRSRKKKELITLSLEDLVNKLKKEIEDKVRA
jgi:threonyl-tRNA synthetase